MSVDLTDKRTRKIDTSWKEREREREWGEKGRYKEKKDRKKFFSIQ